MKNINTLLRFYFVSCVTALFCLVLPGCGVFDAYQKNSDGYYEKHYNCCGPIALEKALNLFWSRPHDGVIYCFKKPFDRGEISRAIQEDGMGLKEALAFFHKDAICITWPSEIKEVAEQYGFEIITLKEFEKLDPKKDVAIVLVHSKINNYHWLVFPIDDPQYYYGTNTKIDKIYLLKKNEQKR